METRGRGRRLGEGRLVGEAAGGEIGEAAGKAVGKVSCKARVRHSESAP